MMIRFLVTCFFLIIVKSYAQTEPKRDTLISQNPDSAPVFNKKPGGVNSFRTEVANRVDLSGYQWKKSFTVVFNFSVDTDGKIVDVETEKSSGIQEFDDRFIYAIKSIRKKWSPAKVNGIPVKSRFRIPFNISAMN